MQDFESGTIFGLGIMGMLWVMVAMLSGAENNMPAVIFEQAVEVCEGNGGLHHINAEGSGDHQLHCSNGAMFTYRRGDRS